MRSVFGDLAQDVQRSIGYYTSLHKDAKLERLIGLGSTFRLPGLRKYLKQQLQMDVYRMEQFKRLSADGPKAGEFQSVTLNMATAYGLALQGLDMAALRANLMPTGVIRDAMWKRKVRWFGVAAGVAVAAGAAMCLRPFLDGQAVADAPPSSTIRDVIDKGQRLKTDAADLTQTTVTNTVATDLMALLEGRDFYAHILDDVNQMLQTAQRSAGDAPELKLGPAFTADGLTAEFVPPGTDSQGQADPTQTAKIHVVLKVSTNIPEARKFQLSTLEDWLNKNADRPGVPYKIVANNPSVWKGERSAEGPKAPPGGGGGEARTDRPAPITLGVGKSGLTPMGGYGEGGGAPPPSSQPEQLSQQAQAASETIRRLAPAPSAPALPEGTKTNSFEVTWDCVIKPKETKPAGGGT
jgi:hypothetical protein